MSVADVEADPFEDLYRRSDDPWSTATRWYERRKLALVMAMLPHERYASAYEGGCGNGVLAAALASRADRLVASDANARAVELARARLAHEARVDVVRHRLPEDFPHETYALVVLSEVVYFLAPPAIDALASRVDAASDAGTVVLACDWRARIEGWGHRGDEAHGRFGDRLAWPVIGEYRDDDVIVTTWSRDTRSVATRDGLRTA